MTMYLNRQDIISIAEDAGIEFKERLNLFITPYCDGVYIDEIEKFADQVAAAEREKMKWESIHTCNPDCQKPVCVAIREAVAAEREACAKVCDEKVDAEYATGKVDHNEMGWTQACAIAIRARGQ